MRRGEDFEVSKEVYERAKANRGYMAEQDKEALFSVSIRYGYGLYGCVVREEDGKYICSYEFGDSCD